MSYLDENGLARVWGKVKNFVNGKVQTDVPANAVFTDEKAKQENVTTNSEYRVLLSGSATNSTETATIKKSSKLKFKASSSELKVGDTESYGTTHHCVLSPSEVGLYRKETQQSSSSTYTGVRMWMDSSTGEYDIQNSSTWDGTNDSLKGAISNLTDLNNYIEVTLPNTATDLRVNYPTGYSQSNCYIVAFLIKDISNIWRTGEGISAGDERIFFRLSDDYIIINNNNSGLFSRPIRIVLQKLGSNITPT